jgi:DNA-binding NarL/FixJ family response regulator
LAGCGVTEAEVVNLVESIDGKILVMLSESIAPDHGVTLINKLFAKPEPPDILLMVTDGRWLGSNPLSVCNAGAIIDVHSFGTGTAIKALQVLAAGKRYVDQRLIGSNSNAMKFSPREQEAVVLLAQGSTNSEIAKTMGISVNTVRDYLSQVYGKLGVRNRSGAAAKAVEMGFTYT